MGSEAEGFIPDVSWCESVYLYMPHHVQNLCPRPENTRER